MDVGVGRGGAGCLVDGSALLCSVLSYRVIRLEIVTASYTLDCCISHGSLGLDFCMKRTMGVLLILS